MHLKPGDSPALPDAPEVPPAAISGDPGEWSDMGKVQSAVPDRLSFLILSTPTSAAGYVSTGVHVGSQ